MSDKYVKIKYQNDVIFNKSNDCEFKLLTKNKYMEDDLEVEVNRDPDLAAKTINANGQYSAASDNLDGYDQVTVDVPNSYSASDEGKVVDNGTLVSQTSITVTENDTYDTTTNNEVVVNVPNSYSVSDEGKVVSGGALVAQTSRTIDENGTYDTTLNNQIVVNVSGGGGGVKNILSGTAAPNADDGNNGDIYLEYNKLYELPAGYTQIEYIESTGTQWIDTLITPDQDTSIEIIFSMNTLTGDKGIYGSKVSGSSRDFETHFYYENNVYAGYNANTDIKSAWGSLGANEKYEVYHNKNLYYKNGSLIKTFNAATFTCPYDLVIFGVRNNKANPTWLCSAKLYHFKMWNDETLVRDMVPIKDDNDVVCLYDVVSETCFYNAGSGNFNAGGNDSEYIVKTYCKVNGTWQNLIGTYIDDVNTEGGGTSDIDTSLLPNSDATKILMSQDDSIASVDHWGRLSLYDKGVTRTNPITIGQDGSFQFAGDTFGTFHLSQANVDVTVYALAKVITLSYGDLGILGITYNKSNGNSALFYTRYSAGFYINTSTYGDDTQTQYTIDDYALVAVSVNQTTKKARFFINGNYVNEKSFSNTGNQVIFNSFGLSDTNTNVCAFKFMGIVDECETDANIIANMQHLMQEFNIGE